jgi:hypothetical protein
VVRSYSYTKNTEDYNLWHEELYDIAKQMPALNSDTSVRCLYLTRKNVFVPDAVFDETRLKDYLSFSFALEELDEIHRIRIPEISAYNCFAIPSMVVSEIKRRFRSAVFINQTCNVLQLTKKKYYETKMNIMLCEYFTDITIFKNNMFVFNNTFETTNVKDILYFVSALKDKFDARQIPIYVSGKISLSELKELKNYFPEIMQEHDKKTMMILGPDISSKYYNMLRLHECE